MASNMSRRRCMIGSGGAGASMPRMGYGSAAVDLPSVVVWNPHRLVKIGLCEAVDRDYGGYIRWLAGIRICSLALEKDVRQMTGDVYMGSIDREVLLSFLSKGHGVHLVPRSA